MFEFRQWTKRILSKLIRDETIMTSFEPVSDDAPSSCAPAQVLLSEGRYKEAVRVARAAIRHLEKRGAHSLLAESLAIYGLALARLGRHNQARYALVRSVVMYESIADYEGAGRACLTAVEELRTVK
ncbi:MAG: hypothetical protein WKF84_14765 [Pyrinomonadaceae bacterium]